MKLRFNGYEVLAITGQIVTSQILFQQLYISYITPSCNILLQPRLFHMNMGWCADGELASIRRDDTYSALG